MTLNLHSTTQILYEFLFVLSFYQYDNYMLAWGITQCTLDLNGLPTWVRLQSPFQMDNLGELVLVHMF